MNLYIAAKVLQNQAPSEFVLEGGEALHASKVMRKRTGDRVDATDGKGSIFSGRVVESSKKYVRAEIENHTRHAKPVPHLILAIGQIKKRDRMEFAIEKSVEMGASEFVIYQGDHSMKKSLKPGRLEAAALSAMKQSRRPWIPTVDISENLAAVLDESSSGRTFFADENCSPSENLPVNRERFEWQKEERLLFIIGPEGGFSKEEVALLEQQEAEPVSLGTYRLRTETAAIAIASLFLK